MALGPIQKENPAQFVKFNQITKFEGIKTKWAGGGEGGGEGGQQQRMFHC